jgi:hypothetical protein
LMTWIGIGLITVVGFIIMVPLLVVGSWFVIINAILGLVNGTTWVLDQMWGTVRGGKRRPGSNHTSGSPIQSAGSIAPTLQPAFERK